MKPGAKVGAERWPYHAAHPGCWEKPHAGVLLAVNDPRAWRGSLAFDFREDLPSQEAVDKHVAWCRAQGLLGAGNTVPVAWEFGKVFWESVDSIRPYAEDLAAWFAERGAALQRAA